MPTRRARIQRTAGQFTPEVLALYRQGRALDEDSEEFNACTGALHKALGLKPWHISPLWVDPADPGDDLRRQPEMVELCQRLKAAVSGRG